MVTARKATTPIYQDKAGEWRWRLVVNGRIIAESGEGYKTSRGAATGFARTVALATTASVEMPPKRTLVRKPA
jgi:uncharacterized protein YegP (UPF0339 family)